MNNLDLTSALNFLREDVRDCNKHVQVSYLIEACILLGLCSGSAIRDTIAGLGFNALHVICCLKYGTGSASSGARWNKSDDGTYFVHP